uniref:Uncharacterized protein n=1 Tax=Rhizophagus irregularis (strain DAOM 181602 / DAOM 197198 / MUCL 43194) TaxID=747089 RepID=U9UEE8_RHIID
MLNIENLLTICFKLKEYYTYLMIRVFFRNKWEEIIYVEIGKWNCDDEKIRSDHNKLVQLCMDGRFGVNIAGISADVLTMVVLALTSHLSRKYTKIMKRSDLFNGHFCKFLILLLYQY